MPDVSGFVNEFKEVLGLVTALIVAIGGSAIYKARKEVGAQEGPSAAAQLQSAIERQTAAVDRQTEQFKENNRMFHSILKEAEKISSGITELRLDLRGK